MRVFCRLCAVPKKSEEFKCQINDQNFNIEQKLVTFCNWNSYRSHHNLPQSVCIPCYLQLEQCWYFRETIARAQQKLCDLMRIDTNLKEIDEQSFDEIQVKEEILVVETVEEAPVGVSNWKFENDFENYADFHERSDDDIDRTSCFDDDNGAIDVVLQDPEPANAGKEDTKIHRKTTKAKPTKSVKSTKQKDKSNKAEKDNIKRKVKKCPNLALNFDIKAMLSHEDVNENGTIKPEKIRAQELCDWSGITNRCYKCNEDFNTNADLWAHFTSSHSNEKMKFICPICPDEMIFLSGRYYRSHIAKSHFPHLTYWYV